MFIGEFGGRVSHYFIRNQYHFVNDSFEQKKQAFIASCNKTDVYQCAYFYQTLFPHNIQTCKIIAPFYIDLDYDIQSDTDYLIVKEQAQRVFVILTSILKLSENEIQIYYSGAKGFHFLVPASVLGIPPLQTLNTIYRTWGNHLKQAYAIPCLDTSIYDRRRLIRIVNTINGKTGLYKIPITIQELYDSSYSTIREMVKEERKLPIYSTKLNKKAASIFLTQAQHIAQQAEKKTQRKKNHTGTKRKVLPCIQYLLQTGIEKGSRNNTAVILANSLLQSNYSEEEVMDKMKDWNRQNMPPLPDRELRYTVQSAISMHESGRYYGCPTIQELGACQKDCRLRNKG